MYIHNMQPLTYYRIAVSDLINRNITETDLWPQTSVTAIDQIIQIIPT